MRRLRQDFSDELVIIGVHSAKFPSEQLTLNIRQAVLRHRMQHPVVNDAGMQIWNSYAINSWPSLVLINPRGKIVFEHSGEFNAEDWIPQIQSLISQFETQDQVDRTPLELKPEIAAEPKRALRFPSRIKLSQDGKIFIADTGHHRILELKLSENGLAAEVQRVFGSGQSGFQDGSANEARFDSPHGLALSGQTLFVADTENHAVRAINLASGMVQTIAGTGKIGSYGDQILTPGETSLRSPWAVLPVEADDNGENPVLFTAMAGLHQIWVQVGGTSEDTHFGPFAGSGREALEDGTPLQASFNQPSDLAFGLNHLFIADPEASAVRAISLTSEPKIFTLVGQGLFEFGDVDGVGPNVRLQHPTGVDYADEKVFVADTYNHKIKILNPFTAMITTLIGDGESGSRDGSFEFARLYEPQGVAVHEQRLYIADTNNHLIRVADLETQTVHTLALTGLEHLPQPEMFSATTEQLEIRETGSGRIEIFIEAELPHGYTLNTDAPISLRWSSSLETGQALTFNPNEPIKFDLAVMQDIALEIDLTLYYCQEHAAKLCLIHDTRLIQPIKVSSGGPASLKIKIPIPAQQN